MYVYGLKKTNISLILDETFNIILYIAFVLTNFSTYNVQLNYLFYSVLK